MDQGGNVQVRGQIQLSNKRKIRGLGFKGDGLAKDFRSGLAAKPPETREGAKRGGGKGMTS